MIKSTITALTFLSLFSANAFAEYTVRVSLDKTAINFNQYYENIGANPEDNNINTSDLNCIISQSDLDPFDATLLKVSDEESLTCVIDYAVPMSTFSRDCTANYLTIDSALTSVLVSKGVNGFASKAYFGECS
jgi:hypothetical protein